MMLMAISAYPPIGLQFFARYLLCCVKAAFGFIDHAAKNRPDAFWPISILTLPY
jgi:hypothetical protein